MYIPTAFAEYDLIKMHHFIEHHSFGLLVSQIEGQSFASQLSFLLEKTTGSNGCLIRPTAKANPQWKDERPPVNQMDTIRVVIENADPILTARLDCS